MSANQGGGVEPFFMPHGEGLQLVRGRGIERDGWVVFSVRIDAAVSALSEGGEAAPELGLEVMAQGCGALLARIDSEASESVHRFGVVGAVRSYRYEATPFRVGEHLEVRVKPDLVERNLIVCDAELYRGRSSEAAQSARLTLIIGEGAAV